MNKSDLQTALLILPEDYRQNAFEFLTEHADYTPEDFIKFIKDQLDQMQRAYEYELQDKDDEMTMKHQSMDMMISKTSLKT